LHTQEGAPEPVLQAKVEPVFLVLYWDIAAKTAASAAFCADLCT